MTSSHPGIWDRVLCGIDATPASVQAAVHAARLMPRSGQLTLCTVVTPDVADRGSLPEETATHEAEAALDRAQIEIRAFHEAELHLREGAPIGRLADELLATRATLVAVGSHGVEPAAGAARSDMATAMLREAPCSVLIVHGGDTDTRSDGEVVVGFDGSGSARRALDAGQELTDRIGRTLRVIVATGDVDAPKPGWASQELGAELPVTEDPRAPVDALTAASASAVLVIVGSRHLRGAPARSSVSERIAHSASCPVLVVR
jgi:nucleotide-binding universal stress UspA family protein